MCGAFVKIVISYRHDELSRGESLAKTGEMIRGLSINHNSTYKILKSVVHLTCNCNEFLQSNKASFLNLNHFFLAH